MQKAEGSARGKPFGRLMAEIAAKLAAGLRRIAGRG
jgi:hypothetical protein